MLTIPGSPGWGFDVSIPAVYRRVKDPDAGPGDPEHKWTHHLPWCPQVDAVYVLSDSDGSTLDVQIELSVGEQVEMVRLDDVRDGLVWTRYHSASGASSRHVKDLLSNIVLLQVSQRERIPVVPMWKDGRLILPPTRVLPEGYLAENDVPERVKRGAWERIAARAQRNPKLAFVLGAAFGGVFVERLKLDSFWVHMTGGSSQGKTTTLKAAAALFGDPRLVVTPWNGTPLGTTVQLGQLGCLTAFKDELGSMTLSTQGLEDLIFKTTEGNRRSTSSRTGTARRSRPWRGVLVSTGNETITGRILNEGVAAARVVEIETPLLSDADTAEEIERLAELGAGWPIAQSLSEGIDMPGLISDAQHDLKMADGGVARRLDRHLILAVAGAALLDRLIGAGPSMRMAALEAAEGIRRALHAELAERGLSPMDRLAAAVVEEMAADPGLFPTLSQYRHRQVDTRIAGFNMRADDSTAATVVIFSNALKQLAARHGIVDITPAIRDGAKDGRLITQGNRHQRAIRIDADNVTRGYFLRIDDLIEASGNIGNSGNIPAQRPPDGGESLATSLATSAPSVATPLTLVPEPPPAPVATWTRADVCAPCVDCGQATPMRDAQGRPQHAYALCKTAPPPPSSAPARDYDAEVSAFAGTVRRRFPDASDADVEAAYGAWQLGTRGVKFVGSPASTGLSWFLKVNAQHGAIPELESRKNGKPDGVERVVSLMDGLAPEYAPTDGAPYVTGLDVNAQYLAAAGSVECGVGVPRTLGGFQANQGAILGLPGYVMFDGDPFDMGRDAWVPTPLAKYLMDKRRRSLPADSLHPTRIEHAVIWDEKRRALSAWAKQVRTARATFMRSDSAMALAALKQVYAAFLGGMLRSDTRNHTDALRHDWSDQTMALSTANMNRAFDKANPRPFAWRRDTAYFAAVNLGDVPGKVEISDQAGKWKRAGRECEYTDAIRIEVENGSAERVNSAIIAECRKQGS